MYYSSKQMDKTRISFYSLLMQIDRPEMYFNTPGHFSSMMPYRVVVAGADVSLQGRKPITSRFHHHALILTIAGAGNVSLGEQSSLAVPGTLAWVDTSRDYTHQCANGFPEWHYYFMGIRGHQLDELAKELGIFKRPVVMGLSVERLSPAFRSLIEHLRERRVWSDARCNAAVAEILAALISAAGIVAIRTKDSKGSLAFARTLETVRNEVARPWSIAQMAALSGVSEAQFFRLFGKSHGTTPMNWLRHERIHKAKQMLAVPGMSISAVAAQCGYPDPYHFSRDYKRIEGHAPSVFKMRMNEG